jgi:DNA primase
MRVEEVVGEFVSLKRAGASMKGLCPFHNEKSSSFVVTPARGIFKCFGCGKGGDSITFVMEHERMSYVETLRWLAKKYSIEIEETQVSEEFLAEKQLADSLFLLNDFALNHFTTQLFDTDLGRNVALQYFKQRGFREDTIKKFGLGFAPDERDALTQKALKSHYSLENLRNLGLTTQYERDFFKNRVMFTIQNVAGRVVAFAGRILQKDTNAPKYINSPETEVYNKSKTLYALNFAKKDIQKFDECILVEGYTDVISLHQAGVENVVASSGTSLTREQIGMIKRFTNNIKILYDGDAAGVKAALRGLDMVLEEDMNVRIVLLPDKEDPDSYVQRVGATDFRTFIDKNAKDFVLFKADLLLQDAQNDPIKKSKVIKEIIASVALIPDAIKRNIYIQQCAHLLGIEEAALMTETRKMVLKQAELNLKKRGQAASDYQTRHQEPPKPKNSNPPNDDGYFPTEMPPFTDGMPPSDNAESIEKAFAKEENTQTQSKDEFQERDIVRILVAFGNQIHDEATNSTVGEYILHNIEDVMEHFDNALYKKIVVSVAELLKTEPSALKIDFFMHHPDKNVQQLAATLLSEPWQYSPNWEARHNLLMNTQKMPEFNFDLDSKLALQRFKLKKTIKVMQINQLRIKQSSDAGDIESMMKHLKVQNYLIEMRNKLAAELKTVVLK